MFMHPSDLIPEEEASGGEWAIIGEPLPSLLPLMALDFKNASTKK
jgi:hypothetical protein